MISKRRIAVNKFIFFASYIILFVSLFLDDMAFSIDISFFVKTLKLLAILCIIICSVNKTWKKQYFKECMLGILIGIIILLCTGDFFFLIIILLGFNSLNISDNSIFKLAYYCCLVMLAVSQFFYVIGILPDVLTYRIDFSNEIRHSLGFVHSNVFPLIVFYMFVYYIAEKKRKEQNFQS